MQLVHRDKQNMALEKSLNVLLSGTDFICDELVSVHVKYHFSPDLKFVLGQANAKKKCTFVRSFWVKNGQHFARKTEAAAIVKVASSSEMKTKNLCRLGLTENEIRDSHNNDKSETLRSPVGKKCLKLYHLNPRSINNE